MSAESFLASASAAQGECEKTGDRNPQCASLTREEEEQQQQQQQPASPSNDGTSSAEPVGAARYVEASGILGYCSVDWGAVIAEGSFGTIFTGRDVCEGRRVAVLVAEGEAAAPQSGVFRYAAEHLALLQQEHPGIVELGGKFCATKGDSACVMYVMRLHGVDDMKSFFAPRASQHQGQGDGLHLRDMTEQPTSAAREASFDDGDADDSKNQKRKDTSTSIEKVASQPKEELLHHGRQEGVRRQPREKVWAIGDYSVNQEDVIGQGRFGTVYRGQHLVEKYDVAIKVLKGPMDKKDRLLTEARELNHLQKIGHPNIIQLFATYRKVYRGEIALVHVLEFCRGGDLKEFLARHDSVSERQARRIMQQLVDCLCHLKIHKVMHRDLKPANILLTSTNIDEAVVKVADWGMAKSSAIDRNRGGSGSSPGDPNAGLMFESAVGTVAYMSPERLQHDFYDFQAEVWAVGVIMYELLFARHPYLHSESCVRTPEELLNAITRAEQLEMMGNRKGRNPRIERRGGLQSHQVEQKGEAGERTLSHECYELMRCMLNPDAKRRYTIEQVRAHPWFSRLEPITATEAVKAIEVPPETAVILATVGAKGTAAAAATTSSTEEEGEEDREVGAVKAKAKAEAVVATATAAAAVVAEKGTPPSEAAGTVRRLPSAEDDGEVGTTHGRGGGMGGMWSFSQRHHTIYQALREYLHVLRYDVIEEEIDPGRGLVLLGYAWELLRAAVKAALLDEQPAVDTTTGCDSSTCVPTGTWNGFRYGIPDDLKQMEIYIQETAQRLKRNLPALTGMHPLGASVLAISMASMGGMDTSGDSSAQPSPRLSQTTYPTAQMLLFQRAVSLIRAAATEELMFTGDDEHDSYMEEEAAQQQGERGRRQHAYERAMVILRLLLQQVVVQRPLLPNSLFPSGAPETGDETSSLQVLTVSLVPPVEEADQRTVQALLHRVEKYYRRCVNVK